MLKHSHHSSLIRAAEMKEQMIVELRDNPNLLSKVNGTFSASGTTLSLLLLKGEFNTELVDYLRRWAGPAQWTVVINPKGLFVTSSLVPRNGISLL